MAINCPKCGYDNPRGSLICSQCYSLLADTVPVPHTVSLGNTNIERMGKPFRYTNGRTKHVGKLGTHSVALYIGSYDEPMITLITSQTVFGRVVPGETQPRLDLTPYGALDKGVSRQHGIMKRSDKGLTFEDMGSSNGSWLNDELLKPYTPSVISSGDRLRLSQLEIELYLPELEG